MNPRERVSLDRFPTTEAFLAHLENIGRDTEKEEEKTPFTFVQPRDTEVSNKDAKFNAAWRDQSDSKLKIRQSQNSHLVFRGSKIHTTGSSVVKVPTGNFVYQDGSDIQSGTSDEDDEHDRSDLKGADELD